jgi:hypothetical protein
MCCVADDVFAPFFCASSVPGTVRMLLIDHLGAERCKGCSTFQLKTIMTPVLSLYFRTGGFPGVHSG